MKCHKEYFHILHRFDFPSFKVMTGLFCSLSWNNAILVSRLKNFPVVLVQQCIAKTNLLLTFCPVCKKADI